MMVFRLSGNVFISHKHSYTTTTLVSSGVVLVKLLLYGGQKNQIWYEAPLGPIF